MTELRDRPLQPADDPAASRTPGPWRLVGDPTESGAPSHTRIQAVHGNGRNLLMPCLVTDQYGTGAMLSVRKADAEFIVTACNAYDRDRQTIHELAVALRDLIAKVKFADDTADDDSGALLLYDLTHGGLDAAYTALALRDQGQA